MPQLKILNIYTETFTNVITNRTFTSVSLEGGMTVGVAISLTNVVPNSRTFLFSDVTVATSSITLAAHGLTTGLAVFLTTTGTVPAPLAPSSNYFVIVVDANTFKLANTLGAALGGTAVTLTTQGSGTDTLNISITTGFTSELQKSQDGATWFTDIASASISYGSTVLQVPDPTSNFERLILSISTGIYSGSIQWIVKGPA